MSAIEEDGKSNGRPTPWWALAISVLVLLAVFATLAFLTARHATAIKTSEQLESFDFTSEVGWIYRGLFDFYADALYTPDDFAAGDVGEPTYPAASADTAHEKERESCSFGTYRITLDLPSGQVYAITADSATYAQKVWVNGQLLDQTGTVSADADGFYPSTRHYTVCFTAGDTPTEIVIQRANFVHATGTLHELYLGPQDQVFHLVQADLIRRVMMLSALLAASLLLFGMSLLLPNHKQFFWFSLTCLFLFIRYGFVDPKPIMVLLPDMNWYVGHKLECSALLAACLSLLLYYGTMFHDVTVKPIRAAGYVIFGLGIAVYVFLPSTIYSHLTQTITYVIAGYLVIFVASFIYRVIRRQGMRLGPERLMMVVGVVIVGVGGLVDALLYRRTPDFGFTQIAILIFVFLNVLALTLEMRHTQEALEVATQREKQMAQTNGELESLYRIRSDFMHDIGHEMRTPLTIMGSYAGLTRRQVEQGKVNERTLGNLQIIESEAVRLGHLVEQMKDAASEREWKTARSQEDVTATLNKAAAFFEPICERKGNRVEVKVETDTDADAGKQSTTSAVMACYAPESILQVLYNLLANSNRHCQNDVIKLMAKVGDDGFVYVTVADHGDGMSAQMVQQAFERGASEDGSTGLGLCLCRRIVEDNGGAISLRSEQGVGTTVMFTLPVTKGNDDH